MNVSYVDILKRKLRFVKYNGTRTEAIFICPFCETNGIAPDTKGHLYVNTQTGVFHCFRCGVSGTFRTLLDKLRVLGEEPVLNKEDEIHVVDVYEEFRTFVPLSEGSPKWQYLVQERKIPANSLRLAQAGEFRDKWYDYVVFPILFKGRIVGYQGRRISEGKPKYITGPKGVPLGRYVYNFDLAQRYQHIILVEGILDALSIGVNAIALFGKDVSMQRVHILSLLENKRFIIMLDRDALQESIRYAKILRYYGIAYIFEWENIPEQIKDPNDLVRFYGRDYVFSLFKTNLKKFD